MKLSAMAAACLAATVIFITCPAAAQEDPRVAQLIAASGQALGVASLSNVKTIRFDEQISAVGLHGTIVRYVDVRNGRFAEATHLSPLVSLDGYDGRTAWSGDQTQLVWNDGGDSDRSSEVNQAYLESYGLWRANAAGAQVAIAGTKTAGGRSYDVLRITPAASKVPFELWFDRATHLPARGDFVGGFVTSTLTFADYRRVRGLNVAHAIHNDSSDGNNSDIRVTRVTFDPQTSETAFARPQTRPADFSMQAGVAAASR